MWLNHCNPDIKIEAKAVRIVDLNKLILLIATVLQCFNKNTTSVVRMVIDMHHTNEVSTILFTAVAMGSAELV